MKGTLIAFSLIMSSLLAATVGYAQSFEQAYVPFAFKAGNTQLPAGNYLIKDDGVSNFITIGDPKTGKTVIVLAPGRLDLPLGAPAKMIFHRYGSDRFLAAIWSGIGSGRTFTATKQEKEVREHLVASNHALTGTEVMIAMK